MSLYTETRTKCSAEVNPDDYQTVAIWRRLFNYTFNAAEIHAPPAELTGLGWTSGG